MATSILGKRRRTEATPKKIRNETSFQVLEDRTESSVVCKRARCSTGSHNLTIAKRERSQRYTPDALRTSSSGLRSSNGCTTILKGDCLAHHDLTPPLESIFEDENQTNLPSTPRNQRQHDALTRAFETPKRHATLRTPNSMRSLRTPNSETHPHKSFHREARKAFTRGCDSQRLVGREKEREELQSFLTDSISRVVEGALYVSGPPGTGKSALVQEVSQDLSDNATSIKQIYVNCVLFNDSLELFTFIADQFGLETRECTETNLKHSLQSLFFNQTVESTRYLLILDEIDAILNHEQSVIHTIFDWCLSRSSNLILIGIANAIDLTDRLLPRLKALNLRPRLLPFLPYDSKEIANVITVKLRALLPSGLAVNPSFTPLLQPAAIQLISKKVAAQSGDLRKAFDLVLRTIDVLENEMRQLASLDHLREGSHTNSRSPLSENKNYSSPPPTPRNSPAKTKAIATDQPMTKVDAESAPRATITHIARIISTTLGNGSSQRLKCLNLHQKLALCSLVALEYQRMGHSSNAYQNCSHDFRTPIKGSAFATNSASRTARVTAPSFQELYENYHRQCSTNEGIGVLSQTEFKDVITSLETVSLVSMLDRKPGKAQPSLAAPGKGKRTVSHVNSAIAGKLVSANIGREELEAAIIGIGGPAAGMLSSIISKAKDG